MSVRLTALVFIAVSTLWTPFSSQAQQFTRLTATSSYACIKFPSGKFGVGKAAKDGYATRSFNVASSEISGRLRNRREALRTRQELFKDFIEKNEISKIQLKAILEAQFAPGVPAPLIAKVVKLNASLDTIRAEIAQINLELSALKDCQRGKTEFQTTSLAMPATILTQNATQIVLSSLLEVDYPGKYDNSFRVFFCIQKENTTAYRLAAGSKNPCSEKSLGGVFDACLAPQGKLVIPLVVTYLSITAPTSLIESAQADINKEYPGNYTIKSISSDPNSPCGYLNK